MQYVIISLNTIQGTQRGHFPARHLNDSLYLEGNVPGSTNQFMYTGRLRDAMKFSSLKAAQKYLQERWGRKCAAIIGLAVLAVDKDWARNH